MRSCLVQSWLPWKRSLTPRSFNTWFAEEQQLRSQQGGLQTQIAMLKREQGRNQAEVDTLKSQQNDLVAARRKNNS